MDNEDISWNQYKYSVFVIEIEYAWGNGLLIWKAKMIVSGMKQHHDIMDSDTYKWISKGNSNV
jgi:hypothetical protein